MAYLPTLSDFHLVQMHDTQPAAGTLYKNQDILMEFNTLQSEPMSL